MDRCPFRNAHDLEQNLATFRCYYSQSRFQQGLAGATPEEMAGAQAPQQVSDNYMAALTEMPHTLSSEQKLERFLTDLALKRDVAAGP